MFNTDTDWTTSKIMSGFEYGTFRAEVEVTHMAAVRAAASHSSGMSHILLCRTAIRCVVGKHLLGSATRTSVDSICEHRVHVAMAFEHAVLLSEGLAAAGL